MSSDKNIKNESYRKNLKFFKADQSYLKKRKDFSKKFGKRELWDVIDHWPLYCGMKSLARYQTIIDSFRNSFDVPGHVAEFGSYRGSVILLLAKILRIYDPYSNKIIHSFESFEGMRDSGKAKGSYHEMMDVLSLYGMDNEVFVHKGKIEKTLPDLLKKDKALSFSFVYYDLAQYDVAKLTLDQIHPRLSKNSIVMFDEWNFNNLQEEGVAVNEFLKKHQDEYETIHVKHTNQPSLMIKKIKHY